MVLLFSKNLCKYQSQLLLGYSNLWPFEGSLTCFDAFFLFYYVVVNLWVKGSGGMYVILHSSTIANSKNVETFQMSIKQ